MRGRWRSWRAPRSVSNVFVFFHYLLWKAKINFDCLELKARLVVYQRSIRSGFHCLLWRYENPSLHYTKMDQIRFFKTSLSLSRLCGGDTTMKLPNENSHQVFKTRRVRYARADELELYSSSTTSPVKRRHQLMLRFYSCSRIVGG